MTDLDWNKRHERKLQAVPANNGAAVVIPLSEGDSVYGLSALSSESTLVATAPAGTRNDALNRAWFRMGRIIAGGNLTTETARQSLADAARQAGLAQDEIEMVLRTDDTSAVTAATLAPRVPTPLAPIPEATVLPPPTGDPVVDAEATSNAVRDKFPLLDWHELWEREDTEEWILEPLLPARRLVALFSAPKVGKSLLMLEIAIAVARGTEALGTKIDRPRRVLYVDFENDPRGDIYERCMAMGVKPDHLENLCYLSYPTLAKLDTYVGALELMAIVAEYECEVVVIDTISRAVGGEENENDTWLAFYRNTGLAMKQAGVACIRLDHTGKDHDKGMRGGSAKYGDVDAVWKLAAINDDTFRLDCTDHRLPIPEKNIVLKRIAAPHLHHQVDAAGRSAIFTALIDKAVDDLDRLDVPIDFGRDKAREALKAGGAKAGNDVLTEALKRRRIARNLAPEALQ